MSEAKSLGFSFSSYGIDWPQLEQLFKAAGLGSREGIKIRRAFENSSVVCFVTDDRRMIGAGRAITDGEYHGVIYDIVVHPDYQRKGIGTQLMRKLIERLPVWRVLLVAAADVQPFYGQLGFQPASDVMAKFDRTKLYDSPPA